MLGQYYYHEILRKTIIAFGTIFNDIHIRHRDGAGKETSDMRVPLAYGPMQKFLARLEPTTRFKSCSSNYIASHVI